MASVWISAGTYYPTNIINPVYAACEAGEAPDEVHILTPEEYQINNVLEVFLSDIIGDFNTKPTVTQTVTGPAPGLQKFNQDFQDLLDEYTDSEIAVDLTGNPGIYPAIMFRELTHSELRVDRIYYLQYLRAEGGVQSNFYPELPATVTELINIIEVFTDG